MYDMDPKHVYKCPPSKKKKWAKGRLGEKEL
jgi:hypothetical protein